MIIKSTKMMNSNLALDEANILMLSLAPRAARIAIAIVATMTPSAMYHAFDSYLLFANILNCTAKKRRKQNTPITMNADRRFLYTNSRVMKIIRLTAAIAAVAAKVLDIRFDLMSL